MVRQRLFYRKPTAGTTTNQVGSIKYTYGGTSETHTYTYDGNGNILSVNNGTSTTSYVYDSQNQLIRENNQAANKTWVWEYDRAGNITSRKEYAYTTGTLGTAVDTVPYTYGDTTWRDLMTTYDGNWIHYDGVGNPDTDGTWDYTWRNGRELASMTNGSTTWTFTYNVDGIRTKRTNGSTTYVYTYNGSTLTQLDVGTNRLFFVYDGTSPTAVVYNGTTYYYQTNLQGDIIALLNSSGTKVVEYTYDAWGNILSTTGTLASTLGVLNPLRYRGYVYDAETGLYYLQSRYYNPDWGRFLNADAFAATGQGFIGNNMFAYCGNNPVRRYDAGGMLWKELVSSILHGLNSLAIAIGIDTAAFGAFFLMMEQDNSGVYHAKFNCWQQLAGYNEFYDFAFDLGTSMIAAQFSFSYGGQGYTIWAWKGDYINLGAGAELGIYIGSSGHRIVDTSYAMWMGMIVTYNNERIIEYFPHEDQWWITGFNPKYQNVNANDLCVIIGVRFNNSDMYYDFKNQWEGDSRWSFYDCWDLAILQF